MSFSPAIRTRWHLQFVVMVVATCLVQEASAFGQLDPAWGSKMFEVTEIKFGSVAKGADSPIQLRVKNVYKEDIQITNLTTGCSCVSWDEITKPQQNPLPIVIPSGQQRTLTLRLDTIRYDGERKSNAKVYLLDPVHGTPAIVEFPVLAYIRRDIVVSPGAVNFGTIDLGTGAERKVDIHYAGRNDWKLTQAKVTNPLLTVALKETARLNDGLVKYELVVTLRPDAPVGTVRDQVTMTTDDANNPQVSVQVEAKVEADIAITDLQFGTLVVGQSKVVNVIIRGKKPFKIEELYRERKSDAKLADDAFKVKLNMATSTVHSLPVTLTAPNIHGAFEEEFFVKVTDRPQPISFKARVRILEQTGAAKQ